MTTQKTKTAKRPYIVTAPDGIERLVNASSHSAAINHIARPGFIAVAASAADVARIYNRGGKLIETDEKPAPVTPDLVVVEDPEPRAAQA